MGQTEMDEVARNAVWTEHCVREGRCLILNDDFGGIRSPRKSAVPPTACTPLVWASLLCNHTRALLQSRARAADYCEAPCVLP